MTEPMSDNDLDSHESVSRMVLGRRPELSEREVRMAERTAECVAEIRRLRDVVVADMESVVTDRTVLVNRIAELEEANHDLAVMPTEVILSHNRTIELRDKRIAELEAEVAERERAKMKIECNYCGRRVEADTPPAGWTRLTPAPESYAAGDWYTHLADCDDEQCKKDREWL